MAFLFCACVEAQTGLVEFPYNPDSDGDDIIGVIDLLDLLVLFGDEFDEESLYVNDEDSEAVYHIVGDWTYGMCEAKCRELPSGKWRMIDYDTWANFYSEIEEMCIAGTNKAWLRETPIESFSHTYPLPFIFGDYDVKGRLGFGQIDLTATCACETHERPKVEYSICAGQTIGACAEEKVANGWYPLSGITSNPTSNGSANYTSQAVYQAFWRWAE